MNINNSDTIAAISSGMTSSGIGIVRISGSEALQIADDIFRSHKSKKLSEALSHTVHYGMIYDGDKLIDEVLAIVMKAPSTYTREDIVEIDCHGGITAMKSVLDTVLKHGARLAEPGEFTKRAFLNGRIDLTQAEAVIDVINSKNSMALESSLNLLKGNMKEKIISIRGKVLENLAYIEAALDDPEHISLDDYGIKLEEDVEYCLVELDKLLKSSENGRIIKEGIKTVIVGKPNAGKSSLMNMLLEEERAIVTDVAGTTRDTLEETMTIDGIPLIITDTAGIRDTDDIVEKIGVEKAVKAIENADLIIYVIDSIIPLDDNDKKIIEIISDKKAVILMNKTDLAENASEMDEKREYVYNSMLINTSLPVINISAKTGEGREELEEAIKKLFFSNEISYNDEIFISNARQKENIIHAVNSLKMVIDSINNNMPEDFYSIDLMEAYEQLGYIIGESLEDDLVEKIFSDFCMGK